MNVRHNDKIDIVGGKIDRSCDRKKGKEKQQHEHDGTDSDYDDCESCLPQEFKNSNLHACTQRELREISLFFVRQNEHEILVMRFMSRFILVVVNLTASRKFAAPLSIKEFLIVLYLKLSGKTYRSR